MSDTCCPVFCIVDLPIQVVNKFFQEANKATEDHSYEFPVGFLVTSMTPPKIIEENATVAPIEEDALKDNAFVGKTPEDVVRFALDHFDKDSQLINDQMVILDGRTAQDDTCLLLSLTESSRERPGLDEAPEKWNRVRSDFESSILTIMTKESGAGGDEHFETSMKGGYEGVLRISGKHAEES